jgi:GNAT superfamily N-acetyltransferase
MIWRPMQPGDLAAADALADAIYPDHYERPAVMAERLRLAPDSCFVLADGARLAGYLVSHPWAGPPPPLDSLLGALPATPDHHYLHDLALAPPGRGAGHAARLLRRFAALPDIRLIAVGTSQPFWRRQGFAPLPIAPAKLASYGPGAAYMGRLA